MQPYVARSEEGAQLDPCTLEVTDYLQDCFEKLERGGEDFILSDPYYQREPPITDEQVACLIAALDQEYEGELGTYPAYHRNRSGANAPPEWHRLSPRGQRALVEGLARIVDRYRAAKLAAGG